MSTQALQEKPTAPAENEISFSAVEIKETFNMILVFSVIIGIIAAVLLKTFYPSPSETLLIIIAFPGSIFFRMLQGMLIPIVLSSVTTSISGLSLNATKKMSIRSIEYFVATTVIASVIGIVVMFVVQPGNYFYRSAAMNASSVYNLPVSFVYVATDILRNLFPDNLIKACIESQQTTVVVPKNSTHVDISTSPFTIENVPTTNYIGLQLIAVVFGIVVTLLPPAHKSLFRDLLLSADHTLMNIIEIILYFAPIGIASLIAGALLNISDYRALVSSLGIYFVAMAIAILVHVCGILMVALNMFSDISMWTFFKELSPALAIAFGTSSSSATIPISRKCLITMGIDKRVAGFVIPVGATVNMDGSAIYQTMTTLLFIQIQQRSIHVDDIFVLIIAATLTSITMVAVPGGLAGILIVSAALEVPSQEMVIIAVADILMDRIATIINILGDAVGCFVVQAAIEKELSSISNSAQPSPKAIVTSQ